MTMFGSKRPRFFSAASALGAAALVAGALFAVATPAGAVNLDGKLQIKGPGSAYTWGNGYTGVAHYVSLSVAAGSPASYSIKVVNTGSATAQYNLRLPFADPSLTIAVTSGSLVATPLALGEDGYFTAPIKPGTAQLITIKITPPAGAEQQSYFTGVELYATDGTFLDNAYLYTNIKAPAKGNTAYDIFVTASGSPAVGGSALAQIATAPSFKVGATATFGVKLRNDSPLAAAVGFGLIDSYGCSNFTPTVKAGSVTITAEALASTYETTLAPGATKVLTVTIKYTSVAASDFCTADLFEVLTLSGGSFENGQLLNVNTAV